MADATAATTRRAASASARRGPTPASRCPLDELTALLRSRAARTLETLLRDRRTAARSRLGRASSPTRARCSFRSRCSAATTATTARSRSRPPSSTCRILTPTRSSSIAAAGAPRRVQGGAVHAGGPAGGALPEAARGSPQRGYASTLDYVRAVAISVIEDTGLLPHLNPGVMSYEELARLKHVSASMGIMLETSSDRLSSQGRSPLRVAGQAAGGAAADDRRRGPARDPVHDRDPRRHRRDARGSARRRCWRSATSTCATTTSKR